MTAWYFYLVTFTLIFSFVALSFPVVMPACAAQQHPASAASGPGPSHDNTIVSTKRIRQVITVGGTDADIAGYTSAAIQMAVDALTTHGGGVVRLMPGTYEIMAPVRLTTGLSLRGSGKDTILRKLDGFQSPLVIDGDFGMTKVTVRDASGFLPGMGVQIYDAQNKGGWAVTTAKIIAIDGNVLYIDNYLCRDYRSDRAGMVSNTCSLIEATHLSDVSIAGLVIDGSRKTNRDLLNGCRGGGIYLFKAKNCLIENVEVKNFTGDGISWQITEDITVRNCTVHHCAHLGLHPGTGSARTTLEACTAHDNGGDGIYLCWRVQNSIFRKNTSYKNHQHGISIGHKDTDNLFEDNHIYENAGHGIYFRDENEQNGAHRNTFRNNTVENNGSRSRACGFYVAGITCDILIEKNTIRDTGRGTQRAGVYIGKNASNIKVLNNQITGHEQGDIIDESAK